nr:DUF805 domain-containing protein [uncultured Brevundimonas sp.]
MPFVAGMIVLGVCTWASGYLPDVVESPARVVVGYSALCVLSLRLHDCGRSGWWSWMILVAAIGAGTLAPPLAQISTIALALTVGALAIWPGQKAFNRHGPPPAKATA